jgi:hypothetical protein
VLWMILIWAGVRRMFFVGAGVAELRGHQLGGFGDHGLACFDQRAHMLVAGLEGVGQDGEVFNVFMHHRQAFVPSLLKLHKRTPSWLAMR